MNVLQISYSSIVFWKELVFVETRVGAEPKTAHLKAMVAAQRAKFDAVWFAEREIEFAVSEAQAKATTAEARVDGFIEEVYSAGAYEVKQKRKDPRYEKLFKMPLSSFVRLNFVAQKEAILRMKNVLELDIYGAAFRQAQEGMLDQALAEIERMISVREQLAKRQRLHRQDVERWKDETNQVRMDVYGELVLLSETLGDSWARGFFPLQKAVKKLSAEEKAVQDEARAEKRLKKADQKRELEALRLDKAKETALYEKEKVDLEIRMKEEAKGRADKREADRLAEERRKLEEERLKLEDEQRKLENMGQLVGNVPVEEPAPM